MTSVRDPFEHSDAAYVLGALDAAERAAFEEHLPTCAACRGRVAEAASIVALLPPPSVPIFDDVPMPDTLLPGLLRNAQRERTRRRRLTGSIAALAAACLVALVVVIWPAGEKSAPPVQAFQAVRQSPVHATATLVDRKWGTEIDLHCRYDRAVNPYVQYRLSVTDVDNNTYDAGSWTLVPGQVTNFTGGAAVQRDRVAKLQILRPDGRPILQLTV